MEDSATAVATPPPAPQYVMAMTPTEELIARHSKITLDEMPEDYRGHNPQAPVIPGRTRKVAYMGGKVREFPASISWINRKVFKYRWFTEARLKRDPRCAG